ncbi:hypothetical protein C8Q79DRAFT_880448, partial [Trametes meyenii]
ENEVSPAIQSFIHNTVVRALRDPVGRRDHALHARVATNITSESAAAAPFPASLTKSRQPPDVVLNENLNIGSCWSMSGPSGQVGIVLPHLMYPTFFSIDHVPWEIMDVVGEAPRSIIVWGVVDGEVNMLAMQGVLQEHGSPIPIPPGRASPPIPGPFDHYVPLASFEYDVYGSSPVQSFPVYQAIANARMYFGIFVVEIVDNWGAPFTCMYRVRIHG